MRARPHPGAAWVARRLRELTADSALIRSHADCDRIQDPYSLRCVPQVLGASLDGLAFAVGVAERELASATDNPLVFAQAGSEEPWHHRVLSSGNFHAQPVALAADVAAIALAALGSLAERRLYRLMDETHTGLPAFLTRQPGLHSGLMLVQYTAAALASENKTLAHPASVDSLPTSAGQEDHVSMAPWAGRKLLAVCENTARVLGIELLAAAQAVDSMQPLATTPELQRVQAAIREHVPLRRHDHRLDRDIDALSRLVRDGAWSSFLD
jgi:histidine ammonia-lyase